jgi:hypothetical protein
MRLFYKFTFSSGFFIAGTKKKELPALSGQAME